MCLGVEIRFYLNLFTHELFCRYNFANEFSVFFLVVVHASH